jgi:hypothetical protein
MGVVYLAEQEDPCPSYLHIQVKTGGPCLSTPANRATVIDTRRLSTGILGRGV